MVPVAETARVERMRLLVLALLLQADPAAPRPKPLVTDTGAPVVKLFLPGFEVRELPVSLTNITNIEYADDGRLFAAGYDGRLHVLRDTDGDGLEDQVTTFQEKTSDDYALGIQFWKGALYVMRRHAVLRYEDTKGDGIPDRETVAATGWRDPEVDQDALLTHRRVDDALGLAIAPDGSTYISIGTANYSNGYLVGKDGQGHVDLRRRRGCVLKLGPDGKNPEIFATGVRFIVSMQINRAGDLFGTDQEGATWLPNGNPFDELLHLEKGRHYGFPPRHPKYLPDVIDEPSVFDYGPQHQSTCGFRFNESRKGREAFGPASWEGDAFVTAMSRGKLYRTQLVKTAAGYVARNQLLASINMLPVDAALSPRGELVLACHSGSPDWGSGPKGLGKLFKIRWKNRELPQPLLVHPTGPDETAIVFDRPLDPAQWKDLSKRASVEFGPFVTAGDRFERFRPGYQVVKNQMAAPRWELPILSTALSADGRSILIQTPRRDQAVGYAISLSSGSWGEAELAFELTGVDAEWTAAEGSERWKGWLPHLDLGVSKALTKGSAEHDRLWSRLERPGRLTLRTTLDLKQMLQPAIQLGSSLGYDYPPEHLTVVSRSTQGLRMEAGSGTVAASAHEASLAITPGPAWVPVTLRLDTGPGADLALSFHTDEDPRPRAFPLRRFLLPWARPAGTATGTASRPLPELEGGRWAEGKKIFQGDRAGCSRCHSIRGEGGRIGADLSNLIHRDYESVMRDIVEPSAAINPDYLAYTVRLKNGDVLAGVVVNSTPEAIVFGTASGETLTVARDRVDVMEPSKVSLMPENLLKGLSKDEIRDLMTFLLRPPPDDPK
jgi:putative heme-binding domain-containing protein